MPGKKRASIRVACVLRSAIAHLLPPGFPAAEIDGEHYWDGSLLSNTPLQWVVEHGPHQDTLVLQIDLWSSRGDFPRTVIAATSRGAQKRIGCAPDHNKKVCM